MRYTAASLALLAFLTSTIAVAAASEENDYVGNLTGGWGGARGALAARGIDAELVYTFDYMANVKGGIKKGSRGLDNFDAVFSIDGEKLAGASGLSGKIYLLNNNGGKPDAALVGSAQGINNIEVPKATHKLYEAWLQQNLFADRVSILAGLYDLNSEFYVTDSSALFIHSTYGIGTEFSQSGLNGPSIFPTTSLAARIRVQPTQSLYMQAAIFDGAPGAPDDLKGTQIEFNDGEGALFVAEAGYTPAGGKLAFGAWVYSDKFPDQLALNASGTPQSRYSQGVYLIGERNIFREAGSEDQGLTGFARIGWADADVNQIDMAWSTGIVYTGLVPSRDAGQLGLAVSGAQNGGKFKRLNRLAGSPVKSAETAFELTYSDNITPWLSLQPDMQYIVNPGTDPTLDDALILGGRLTLTF